MTFLTVSSVAKSFDGVAVLTGIDLHIAQGETVCLLGPSGCGKTTLLRIIAGLEHPDQGQVLLQGEDITATPPHRRDFGLMFQDFVLFPHLTVAENIAFGPRMQNWPRERTAARVRELLEQVELNGFEDRKVYELSGGQQQRVALARSLAPQPRLLMLDEPLGALDRSLRDQLLDDLRQLLTQLHQTALYVTHDQFEAFAIADRIVLINEGRVEQQGSPSHIYHHPATLFVARFLGFQNVFSARLITPTPQPALDTPFGILRLLACPPSVQAGDTVTVVIRPEGAHLAPASDPGAPPPASDSNLVRLRLQSFSFRGAHTLLRFQTDGLAPLTLAFEFPGFTPALRPGDELTVAIDPAAFIVLPSQTF